MKEKITDFLGRNKIKALLVLLIAVGGFFLVKHFKGSQAAPQYQTAQAQKGTLVKSVSASGQVTTGDSVAITTTISGVVKDVLVKNGDEVSQGQVIADVTPDQDSQQKLSSALSSLMTAKNTLSSAQADLNTLQNTEFTANQKLINDAVARNLAATDPTYIEENAAWLAAEANYKNQQNVIAQAQQAVNSDALAYAEISPTITAPASGIIKGLTITPGTTIAASQTTSGSASTAANTPQTVGTVGQQGPIQAEVNLAEIDAVNVAPGQKVTMTLDAFPDKTFTGRVVIVNTNGVVSSGVTTYPAIIDFDTGSDTIYPNMGVTANIITKVDNDVLLVPNAAVETSNGQSTVRVLKNGQVQSVPVEIGDSNDTNTIITSGLNEGDNVVTSVLTQSSATSGGTSPFGGGLGGRGFGPAVIRGGGGGGRGG